MGKRKRVWLARDLSREKEPWWGCRSLCCSLCIPPRVPLTQASQGAQRAQGHSLRERSPCLLEPAVDGGQITLSQTSRRQQAGADQEAHSFLACVTLVSNKSFLGLRVVCAVSCPWHTPIGSESRRSLMTALPEQDCPWPWAH